MKPGHKGDLIGFAVVAEAKKNGWAVISMKKDWKVVFPFDGK